MKNSQYANQASCSVSDLVRITFNEMYGPDPIHVITISMNLAFAKDLAETINKSIAQFEQNVEAQEHVKNRLS